ncbi:2TM domain-containing protein [Kordia sp. SMS9]|uniref:2TM domain-containing protein n=1 Tax=Kordia sp. SMS9 TaxID=2282170 RepID=UPI000E0D651D|nr:2TM domain-containing protein [Kordia sp. SMS9]
MDDNNRDQERAERYLRAQKRVDDIRGFYIHLLVYICVNLFISIKKIMRNMENGETFEQAFYDFGTYVVWLAWGIGLAFHAFNVFFKNGVFGSNWEERKIREYMEDEEDSQNWY